MRREQMIKMRLGGSNDPLEPLPQKPRGMHWRTYRRLRDQAHAAKAEADYLLAESIPGLGQFLHPVPPRRKRQRGRRDGGPKPPPAAGSTSARWFYSPPGALRGYRCPRGLSTDCGVIFDGTADRTSAPTAVN